MNKLTLVILAAGMGSRYGGLKQLDQLGPSGETVMDYSVFDAMRAGFDRVVFIIRRDIEEEFKKFIGSRYADKIKVEYAFQDKEDLPGGFTVPEGRVKPWGTGHAVYAARELLNGPFAVINADDFYGADSYKQLAAYLRSCEENSGKIRGAIVSFVLNNTLSENGSVSRGMCSSDADGNLCDVVEHTRIFPRDGRIFSELPDGSEVEFTGNELVSMNCWGFSSAMVGELERLFLAFLKEKGTELKSEFYLPGVVDTLIKEGRAEIKTLCSKDSWFGVTYQEDKPVVQKALRELAASGAYPENLNA